MTDNPLASLLAGVPIWGRANTDGTGLHELVFLKDVLAALTLPEGEAGKAVERLTTVGFGYDLTDADKAAIRHLLARITADAARIRELEAERDEAREHARMNSFAGEGYVYMQQRAEAAEARIAALEAQVERMRGALEFYADKDAWSQPPVRTREGLISVEYENQASKVQRDRGDFARRVIDEASNG